MFAAKLYKIDKGKDKQHAYKATIKRDIFEKLKLKERDGMLIKIEKYIFPTVLTKIYNKEKSFTYSFSIPKSIGDKLHNKIIEFELIKKSLNPSNKLRCVPWPLFDETSIGNPFYFFENKNKVKCWIYSKGCKEFDLPKNIPLNDDLIEICGAYFCEGLRYRKKQHNYNRFSFSNADPKQIEWFIIKMKQLFKIKENQWNVQILYRQNKNILRNFWLNYGFSKNKLNLCKNETIRAENGVCIVYIESTVLAEIFQKILQYSKDEILKNSDFQKAFFKGVSRGDLGVILNKNKKMRCLTFSTKEREDVEFFNKVCQNLDIKTSKSYFSSGCWNSYITGLINFKKVAEYDLISHEARKKKFEGGFVKLSNSKRY